jgi:hypothetical protein
VHRPPGPPANTPVENLTGAIDPIAGVQRPINAVAVFALSSTL